MVFYHKRKVTKSIMLGGSEALRIEIQTQKLPGWCFVILFSFWSRVSVFQNNSC